VRLTTRPLGCLARVAAVRALSRDILEVDLDMGEPADLSFQAGQWISVPFGPKNVRAYSIASAPRSARRITLCADVAPGGMGSTWFCGLAVGQAVEFKAPFGGFVFRRDDRRRPLFVAEEIGIVPIRSMLADLEETGFDLHATLVFWARDRSWLPYHEEFVALAGRRRGFVYHPVLASPDGGSVRASVEACAPDDVRGLVAYVSGGGATIETVREVLMARGLDRKSVRWEKFW
jgi:phenol hydroxylase P5 protein